MYMIYSSASTAKHKRDSQNILWVKVMIDKNLTLTIINYPKKLRHQRENKNKSYFVSWNDRRPNAARNGCIPDAAANAAVAPETRVHIEHEELEAEALAHRQVFVHEQRQRELLERRCEPRRRGPAHAEAGDTREQEWHDADGRSNQGLARAEPVQHQADVRAPQLPETLAGSGFRRCENQGLWLKIE